MAVESVIACLKASAQNFPEKTAFADKDRALTYEELLRTARSIGSVVSSYGLRCPVAVFMDKTAEAAAAFLGVVYGGCFYCPLDSRMPVQRLMTILSVLRPVLMITSRELEGRARELGYSGPIRCFEEISQAPDKGRELDAIADGIDREDPLYVLFTSGSTGVPKGVLVSEGVVLNYLEWLEESFSFTHRDVFGNQAPLYFDVSVHDIYGALYFGARMEILPPSYFSFPVKLVDYMQERGVTAFLWVPSAMGIMANLDVFSFGVPEKLRYVMFAGEVLPEKVLDYWLEHVPGAVYANLYGPTETFVCTAYVMGEEEKEARLRKEITGLLPIGRPIKDSQAIVLDEHLLPVKEGEAGELYMGGSCLALGYYRDEQRTAESFAGSPRLYRTGDMVRWNEKGELCYLSRRDDQIKHMGYRIELGEIEAAALGMEGISACACIYDEKKKRLILCYAGREQEKKELEKALADKLPAYMMPGHFRYFPVLPQNANGKLDRKELRRML
ncbi:MAG: amino acid adenylation domain-containing protein [Lachnospiraceae bacterium]|nr:amino acid adenylation domain-containing protein [Lachnospiraceae bacterium]